MTPRPGFWHPQDGPAPTRIVQALGGVRTRCGAAPRAEAAPGLLARRLGDLLGDLREPLT